MESTERTATPNSQHPVQAIVNVNEGSYNAQKQVNLQIMRKIGQLVIALRPEELVVQEGSIYWKVPLCVVNLSGSEQRYLLKSHALVDAISLCYIMSDEFAQRIKTESAAIIHSLYPDLKEWEKQVGDG